jgi:hypothetical protein
MATMIHERVSMLRYTYVYCVSCLKYYSSYKQLQFQVINLIHTGNGLVTYVYCVSCLKYYSSYKQLQFQVINLIHTGNGLVTTCLS